MTFDEGATKFTDQSLDLIHIDGLHTYEAVKNDFLTWKNKLKEGGTLIFHDWNVQEKEFGVWKLWEEIKDSGVYVSGNGLWTWTRNNKTTKKPDWHNELEEDNKLLKTKEGYSHKSKN